MRTVARYGWTPDLPDARDLKLAPVPRRRALAPPHVDLRSYGPVIYDQGQIGSCTANAIGAALQFDMIKQKAKVFRPSRLFIYYNERVIEDTVYQDAGAQIRDGAKVVAKLGVCGEDQWAYDESKFMIHPPTVCYKSALDHQALLYFRVRQTSTDLEACLADGFPVVFGFTVYQSFESDAVALTGICPMPNIKGNEGVVGGHAVLLVGYDRASRTFIVRNSWGVGWGQKGYFTMPYEYVTSPDFADDFWTFRKVE